MFGGGKTLAQQTKHRQGMLRCHFGIWESMEEILQAWFRAWHIYMFKTHLPGEDLSTSDGRLQTGMWCTSSTKTQTWKIILTLLTDYFSTERLLKQEKYIQTNATVSLLNVTLLIFPHFPPLSFISLLPVLLSPPAPKTAAWLTHPSSCYKAPANTYWLNHKEGRNEEMTNEHTGLRPRCGIK